MQTLPLPVVWYSTALARGDVAYFKGRTSFYQASLTALSAYSNNMSATTMRIRYTSANLFVCMCLTQRLDRDPLALSEHCIEKNMNRFMSHEL
jgi:hypothetical protein